MVRKIKIWSRKSQGISISKCCGNPVNKLPFLQNVEPGVQSEVEPSLAKSVVGKAILALGKKQMLTGKLRNKLGDLVITAEFGDKPDKV